MSRRFVPVACCLAVAWERSMRLYVTEQLRQEGLRMLVGDPTQPPPKWKEGGGRSSSNARIGPVFATYRNPSAMFARGELLIDWGATARGDIMIRPVITAM